MFFQSLTIAALSLAHSAIAARAGANVYGCVEFGQQQFEPLVVTFTPGSPSDQNIDPAGYANSTLVSDSGVTCAHLGYVHEASSFQDSIWSLGYKVGAYSGFTSSTWTATWWNNKIVLSGESPETVVCGTQHKCKGTTLLWDQGTQGPIYIIFTPGAKAKTYANAQEGQTPLELR
ncbi:hypothetical protein PTT_13911 [Pyrenophora teres f. teres 0-1]|uniref:Uncharacterized protein n=2 Tax=Pyrenophora teres f. teres TaxID=97479 RepID=E3RX29_PYRTT|nr:hypothetical protein PTT_13911 [Pyrenophora teres f. teres 0-1]KAE8825337.1 hypothetical protein HRS9139_08447 [Pyrenophora teres f. teres]KAE8844087.1 hypothetical protein HRS9122_05190 [Pyrenophora teres f. teres]